MQMMMELLLGTQASLLGLADRDAALKGPQTAATTVTGWPPFPGTTLHLGGRGPPPPPLKMRGIGFPVPLLD